MKDAAAPERQMGKGGGRLTIFASYLSGAGKSYAMLCRAEADRKAGRDVAAGLLEGGWPETDALAAGFEMLPCRDAGQDGRRCREIDLDACLSRKPQLILIDDLAHLDADGSRHMKRYQDIDELLKAGIDVYTTLDIQHIESIQDTVLAVAGRAERERIPDSVFDRAACVEFVDVEPEDLQARLLHGKRTELLSAYSLAQLSALREIGLRRCADRAARYTGDAAGRGEYRAREHVLVCLSPSPSNARIIRTAARMAGAFRCGLTALYVETKASQGMTPPDKERLRAHIRLAQQLGAAVETVYGDDVPYQIAEFSRLSGVTRIVLGRSVVSRRLLPGRASLTERLIELAPGLDIHIIPDSGAGHRLASRHQVGAAAPSVSLPDLLISALILVLATAAGSLFDALGFTDANIITLYILGVLLVSVFTTSPLCSLLASGVGVLTFNFFFTEPRFSLRAYESGYPVTFLIMFVASLITGSLAARLKSLGQRSAQVAWRTRLLFETNQSLQRARDQEEILTVAAEQLVKIFQRDVVAYGLGRDGLGAPRVFCADAAAKPPCCDAEKEKQVAQWVFANNKRAGAGTETLSNAGFTYLSVRTGERVYGVMGIAAGDRPLDPFESSLLLSVLGECALALESRCSLQEKEEAAVLAKNEQLRANLLRSISHDLRTPLTSISGNASNLLAHGDLFDEEAKRRMYADICDDAMWLINLVENLLSVSRLEEGRMQLRLTTELMDEVVAEALRHVDRRSGAYHLSVEGGEEYLLVRVDARLIVQVLINLIDNAVKYTPPGSEIRVRWRREGDAVLVSVADNGPGIPDEEKPRVFDMFYSAPNAVGDSRRSLGLGLALCKSIVNAHGGEITLADQRPHGAIFTFSIPAGEVELHE